MWIAQAKSATTNILNKKWTAQVLNTWGWAAKPEKTTVVKLTIFPFPFRMNHSSGLLALWWETGFREYDHTSKRGGGETRQQNPQKIENIKIVISIGRSQLEPSKSAFPEKQEVASFVFVSNNCIKLNVEPVLQNRQEPFRKDPRRDVQAYQENDTKYFWKTYSLKINLCISIHFFVIVIVFRDRFSL